MSQQMRLFPTGKIPELCHDAANYGPWSTLIKIVTIPRVPTTSSSNLPVPVMHTQSPYPLTPNLHPPGPPRGFASRLPRPVNRRHLESRPLPHPHQRGRPRLARPRYPLPILNKSGWAVENLAGRRTKWNAICAAVPPGETHDYAMPHSLAQRILDGLRKTDGVFAFRNIVREKGLKTTKHDVAPLMAHPGAL